MVLYPNLNNPLLARVPFVFRQVHSRVTRGFFIVALGAFGKRLPASGECCGSIKTRVRLPRVSTRDTGAVVRRFAVGATCTKFASLLRQCRLRRYYRHNETTRSTPPHFFFTHVKPTQTNQGIQGTRRVFQLSLIQNRIPDFPNHDIQFETINQLHYEIRLEFNFKNLNLL